MRPYGEYAAHYLAAGFAPIPARGKRTIKNQHHGKDKPWVTEDEMRKWSRLHPDANIAARLPRDVIGIDVDAYGDKPGEDTLAGLEADLGELPPTVISTSRLDGVSGIRLFRLPDRYWSVIWPGKAGPGIDMIWHGNRYAIVWPSVHPDTGQVYKWLDQYDDGTTEEIDNLPDIEVLPFLPRDWCDYFARTGSDDDQSDVSDTAEWINRYGGGEMCDHMSEQVARVALAMPDNAHDSARDGTLAVAKDTAYGHRGGKKAMDAILQAFAETMGDRGSARRAGARSEWERHFDGAVRRGAAILEKAGGSLPDDPCEELKPLKGMQPIRNTDAILWAGDVVKTKLRWLQKPVIPFGALSILDGDPGQGKSTLCDTMVARAVQGRDILPFGKHCGRPIRCGIIGAEDDIESVVKARLEAAGYNDEDHGRMVAFYKLKRERGKIIPITFPDGVGRVRSWIRAAGLEFVVVDPITSFFGEEVKTHVDASVRGALSPLGLVARETGCAILLVRHLNKNGQLSAMYRGGGSIAFSAIARSGLITGILPESEGSRFGIAQVKCSNAPKMPVTLAYSIEASDSDADVPVITWHGEAALSADELAAGPKTKQGPGSTAQDDVEAVLGELFDDKDTWRTNDIKRELKDAGCSLDQKVLDKVRTRLGIVSRRIFRNGEGPDYWVWTTAPEKLRTRRKAR